MPSTPTNSFLGKIFSPLWQRQYDKKPKEVCRFGSDCHRSDCKWAHACKLCTEGASEKCKLKACKHGIACRNSPCQFAHPSPSLTCDTTQGQSTPTFDEVQAVIVILQESAGQVLFCIFCIASQVYLQQNKKKAEAESKNCHAKTMLSLEKPIKLI